MSEPVNAWDLPQERIEIRPYSLMYKLDAEEQATLDSLLKEPTVEINYDLNDETDYAVMYQTEQGLKAARVSDTVTLNGVRWHLTPGKNTLPRSVYEFLMTVPHQKELVSCPKPGQGQNIFGPNQLFKHSRSIDNA